MPENSVRPRKPRPRDSAIGASVPSTVAIVADTVATRKLIHAASSMARSLKNSVYQRSDHPPDSVTGREALNDKATRLTIVGARSCTPRGAGPPLKGETG